MTPNKIATDGGEPDVEKDREPVEILLVEDNPNDVELTRKAFEKGRILNNLNTASNGVAALAYLNQ